MGHDIGSHIVSKVKMTRLYFGKILWIHDLIISLLVFLIYVGPSIISWTNALPYLFLDISSWYLAKINDDIIGIKL